MVQDSAFPSWSNASPSPPDKSHYIAHVGFELMALMSQSLESWYCIHFASGEPLAASSGLGVSRQSRHTLLTFIFHLENKAEEVWSLCSFVFCVYY